MTPPLPILAFRDRIRAELKRAGELILTAPTGSGKSTQTPQFLLEDEKGRILVLEPRRISARALAGRVAAETETPLGGVVGYQVRFDSRCGPDTAIVYQTYGVFLAQMLSDPGLSGVGAVLLDEFHERTLECDLALAWLKTLRKNRRPDLKLIVMSATLDAADLSRYLPDAARVDVPGRLFPVDVRHQPLSPREGPADGALAALRALLREGLDGSVLIFMPGIAEIRRALNVLGPLCREAGLPVCALHGSMDFAEQGRVLEESEKPRVIVATNVAETGLTISGVTAVVDSGLHRVAAYDAARGINTLYVSRISRGNAAQRAGRAGRTAPGRCIRLWSAADEAAMAPSLKPEILRLELSAMRLKAASLPETVAWLTPPEAVAWAAAGGALTALGAIDVDGRVTARGRSLIRYPAPPRVASVLEAACALGSESYERACAMAAVFETAGERPPGTSADLAERAADVLAGAREELSPETFEVFRQLKRLHRTGDASAPRATKDDLARAWLNAFSDRLAAREGEGAFYRLGDGRGALLEGVSNPPALILALDVRERAGGGRARRTDVNLFLPFDAETLMRAFPGDCAWTAAAEFDARKGRVIKERRLSFRGLVIARREAAIDRMDRKTAADLWAEQFAVGELAHPGFDERARQFVVRVALARRFYPEMRWPEFSADDWRLIYGEVCAGRNSLKDIERVNLLAHMETYLGRALGDFLARAFPETRRLPSGRTGRFAYHATHPAELAARLGDFAKMTGTLSLCEERLPVLFDILAPNHRTVQKTRDLSSFWANTYPAVKKELQRRYPRHQWP